MSCSCNKNLQRFRPPVRFFFLRYIMLISNWSLIERIFFLLEKESNIEWVMIKVRRKKKRRFQSIDWYFGYSSIIISLWVGISVGCLLIPNENNDYHSIDLKYANYVNNHSNSFIFILKRNLIRMIIIVTKNLVKLYS